MNTDFANNQSHAQGQLEQIHQAWTTSPKYFETEARINRVIRNPEEALPISKPSGGNFLIVLMALVHRAFIKSYRDVVAYGIRIVMYFGLAIMMGTVWLRLKSNQSDIQPFINAIVRLFSQMKSPY